MNFTDINPWIETLGWTLLHSLWQGLAVGLMVLLIRRMVPATASWQYAVHVGGLFVLLMMSVGTYCYLQTPSGDSLFSVPRLLSATTEPLDVSPVVSGVSVLSVIRLWIGGHLHDIVFLWLTGAMLFTLRLLVAWWYSWQLRQRGLAPGHDWEARLAQLSANLGVARKVSLLQSAVTNSPVLLGYFKPVILVPVGMLSGLSQSQVETILLHELAHIRRHDYLVNVLQSVMEVAFFFNPFVWGISSRVRVEREKCCDDIVVAFRDRLTYAQALHRLEEARAGHPSLALGAVGRKNQLLHRIKRIMETSEKKVAGKGKMFPAVVMLLVLTAASWLSVQAYFPPRLKGTNHLVVADTSKKDPVKEKPISPPATAVAPHLQRDEDEDDGEMVPMVAPVPDFNFSIAPMTVIPDIDVDIAPVPDLHFSGDPVVVIPDIDINIAPIPEIVVVPDLESLEVTEPQLRFDFFDTLVPSGMKSRKNWEDFETQFRDEFKEKFADFYRDHQAEFDNMLKDLDRNMKAVGRDQFHMAEELERAQAAMHRIPMAEVEQAMGRAREQLDEARQQLRHDGRLRDSHERMSEQLAHQKSAMDAIVAKGSAFETKLAEQLRHDGYLDKDEKINDIRFENSDLMEVNGKKIKEQDKAKYRELRREYYRHSDHARRSE